MTHDSRAGRTELRPARYLISLLLSPEAVAQRARMLVSLRLGSRRVGPGRSGSAALVHRTYARSDSLRTGCRTLLRLRPAGAERRSRTSKSQLPGRLAHVRAPLRAVRDLKLRRPATPA